MLFYLLVMHYLVAAPRKAAMILSFADPETELIWNGRRSRRLPADIQSRALAKLAILNRVKSLDELRNPPSNRLHALDRDRTGQHSLFPLIGSGVYVSSGRTETRTMSKSSITTDPEWLHNPHAGELLVSEFMEPLGPDAAALADAIAVDVARLQSVISGRVAIDGELDLRLGRYFRMSEGFFLGLQDDYEIRAAKRALNGELDRIIPRAA